MEMNWCKCKRTECKTAKTTKWTTLGRERGNEWKQQPLNISYDPLYSDKPHTTTTKLTLTHMLATKRIECNIYHFWFDSNCYQKMLKITDFDFELYYGQWALPSSIVAPFLCVHRDDVLFSSSLSLPTRPTLLPHTIFPVQFEILRIDVSIVIWLNATFN